MVFFGENGLTSTSANHIANMAKEFAQNIEMGILYKFDFYSTHVGLIGSPDKSQTSVGMTPEELRDIPHYLKQVSEAKSLIAWLREAIKARENLLNAINKKDIEEWFKERGMDFWGQPKRPDSITKDEYIASLNIKERNRIYELQTTCAVFGKFIHPDGTYSNARKNLLKISGAPFEVKGEGRDALVYEYKPTCDEHDVNEVFFNLQAEHRSKQAELNSILHDIDEQVRAENMKRNSEYAEKVREWDVEGKKQLAEFEAWKSEESKKIADLKIVIPDHLAKIYEAINMLGKN